MSARCWGSLRYRRGLPRCLRRGGRRRGLAAGLAAAGLAAAGPARAANDALMAAVRGAGAGAREVPQAAGAPAELPALAESVEGRLAAAREQLGRVRTLAAAGEVSAARAQMRAGGLGGLRKDLAEAGELLAVASDSDFPQAVYRGVLGPLEMADRGLSKRSADKEVVGVADNLQLAQSSLDDVLRDLSAAFPPQTARVSRDVQAAAPP